MRSNKVHNNDARACALAQPCERLLTLLVVKASFVVTGYHLDDTSIESANQCLGVLDACVRALVLPIHLLTLKTDMCEIVYTKDDASTERAYHRAGVLDASVCALSQPCECPLLPSQ